MSRLTNLLEYFIRTGTGQRAFTSHIIYTLRLLSTSQRTTKRNTNKVQTKKAATTTTTTNWLNRACNFSVCIMILYVCCYARWFVKMRSKMKKNVQTKTILWTDTGSRDSRVMVFSVFVAAVALSLKSKTNRFVVVARARQLVHCVLFFVISPVHVRRIMSLSLEHWGAEAVKFISSVHPIRYALCHITMAERSELIHNMTNESFCAERKTFYRIRWCILHPKGDQSIAFEFVADDLLRLNRKQKREINCRFIRIGSVSMAVRTETVTRRS